MLCSLSDLLDRHRAILSELEPNLIDSTTLSTGRCGLSVESVFRCLVLKSILQISYRKLAFYLSDSPSYRCFARLGLNQFPSRSGLQFAIGRISPHALQKIYQFLCLKWHKQGYIDDTKVRMGCTGVETNIALRSDSQLLAHSILVLSRHRALHH